MNILSTEQIRACDAYSIENQGISSVDLMERAAVACYNWIAAHFGNNRPYIVFCGNGNNGGDGLAIARLLKQAGSQVSVWLTNADKRSDENHRNLERVRALKIEIYTFGHHPIPERLAEGTVLIDALLGSGIRLPLTDELANIVNTLNNLKTPSVSFISIDIPSGFNADQPLPEKASAIMADITLCFHCPRLMFFFSESEKFTGQWEVLDIGLDEPEGMIGAYAYQIQPQLAKLLRKRNAFSHKGTYGHALVAGGSSGRCGAVAMAAEACLRSGAGLVTVLTPPVCALALQAALPEAMSLTAGAADHLEPLRFAPDSYTAIGFGPGAGTHDDTARLLKFIIQESAGPMVIDADGINLLSLNKTWLAFIQANSILTPHPGEFDRLAGSSNTAWERLEKAREISQKYYLILVLKDAYTRIILPDGRVIFNSTGNPGMATAGSGDVLTGIITGLLAQHYTPEEAACIGVFIHGLAGDLAAENYSMQGMIAGDIISSLPAAWKLFHS